jgi:dihydroxyacid dehydratase/phosphogluconate dehydratase
VVFESVEDLVTRIDDPDLDVTADDILVLRNAGPKGAPGMPEAGYLPIPKKLAQAGVKDMVRMSDARMSGTAFGTIVLHIAPESATGGPLSLVQNGDRIRLDVPGRRLELLVDEDELERRTKEWQPPAWDVAAIGADIRCDHALGYCDRDRICAQRRMIARWSEATQSAGRTIHRAVELRKGRF